MLQEYWASTVIFNGIFSQCTPHYPNADMHYPSVILAECSRRIFLSFIDIHYLVAKK